MRISTLRPLPMALTLGFALFAAGGHAGTLAEAEARVEADEGNAAAWIALARAQLLEGLADEAVDSAEEAVELAPEDPQAHYWLGNSLGMRIGQVNLLRKMAMAPDLRDAFETAVRLDPDLLDARSALVQYYLQAPPVAGGGIDKARAQVAEIARRNPARGHLAQISIHRHNKDEAAAAKSLDAAVAAVRPDDRAARLGVGMALQTSQRWDEAFAYFRRWTDEQPRAATPRYQIGRLAALSGRHLEAGADALRAVLAGGLGRVDNDPDDAAAWWRLGQIEAHRGRKDAARAAFHAALRLDPADEEVKKSLRAL